MRQNIFDLLNLQINIKEEYIRLYNLFKTERIYQIEDLFNTYYISMYEMFKNKLNVWPYRGTISNIDELLLKLGIQKQLPEEQTLTGLLNLIELIKNIELFLEYLYVKKAPTGNFLLENTNILINKLGYKTQKQTDTKILLLKNDSVAIDTALEVKDINLKQEILNYLDYRIENDIIAKKEILIKMSNYLEPKRKTLKDINQKLEDQIFFNLNKLNIRHNNIEGKNKIEYVSNMQQQELIYWYDKTYSLILTAIRILKFYEEKEIYETLKQNINNKEEITC